MADLWGRVVVLDAKDEVAAVLGADPESHTRPGWPDVPPETLVAGKYSRPPTPWPSTRTGTCTWPSGIVTGRVTKLIRKSRPPEIMRPQRGRMT